MHILGSRSLSKSAEKALFQSCTHFFGKSPESNRKAGEKKKENTNRKFTKRERKMT